MPTTDNSDLDLNDEILSPEVTTDEVVVPEVTPVIEPQAPVINNNKAEEEEEHRRMRCLGF